MMTREDRQEALSPAYVRAAPAACGMTYPVPSRDYGIDPTLREIEERGPRVFETGVAVDGRAKRTTSVAEARGAVGFDLSVKNYDGLRYESDIGRFWSS